MQNEFLKKYFPKTGLALGLIFSFVFSFPAYLEGRRSITGFLFFEFCWTAYIFLLWLLCGWLHHAITITPNRKRHLTSIIRILVFFLLSEVLFSIAFGLICLWLIYVEGPATTNDGSSFLTVQSFVNLNIFMLIAHSLVLFIYRYVSLEKESGAIKLEKEKLEKENIRSQFEALRQQLNPHFLFNSLNSLRSIVSSNPQQAEDFIVQLATVYRYLLKHRSHDAVPLSEEITFIKSYFFLLKIRFEETLSLKINVDDAHLNKLIVPLTLQLLIENAVKHNVISTTLPLYIEIGIAKEKYLIVTNKLQLRLEVEGSSNFGLYNLNKQYSFLANEEIIIQKDQGHFTVKIPLIKPGEVNKDVRL
ncbi:MAG: histidine kinase [Cyclobacteriaceae bacterium]|nr:histidine kinase [Cyclobacteriaceae bacterium]